MGLLNKEKETLAGRDYDSRSKVEERKQVAAKRLQQIQVSDFVFSVLHLQIEKVFQISLIDYMCFRTIIPIDEEVLKNLSEQVAELSRSENSSRTSVN